MLTEEVFTEIIKIASKPLYGECEKFNKKSEPELPKLKKGEYFCVQCEDIFRNWEDAKSITFTKKCTYCVNGRHA